ncbi:MAG: DUF4172 domain-containing protein [Burkholderiales bacterium]
MTPSPTLIWQSPEWPQLVARGEAVTAAIALARHKQGALAGQLLATGISDAIVPSLWVDEVVATSAIEGEELNPASVRSSVMRRLGLAEDNPTPSSRQVDGLVDVVNDATANFAAALDQGRVLRWHAALFPTGTSGLQAIAVGRWRDHADPMQIVSGTLGREVVHYTAPPSAQVGQEMAAFLAWFEQTRPSSSSAPLDGLARAAIAHLWFESIHPFEDGNGRIGRAIVDLAMAQDAAAPQRVVSLSRQILLHRRDYYAALQRAQHGGCDVSAWVCWFARMWALACEDASRQVGDALAKSRFWASHAQTALNPRQRKVIARLLDDGNGGFLGGLNADKYMKMTSTSKATATRDLAALVQARMLFTQGQGKALRYYVQVPGWTHGTQAQ